MAKSAAADNHPSVRRFPKRYTLPMIKVLQFCITLELSVRLTFSCPKFHRLVASICNFWFCLGHARSGSRFSLKNARTSGSQERKNKRAGIPMKFKQPPFEFETQIRPLDLSSVENIADSIALLRMKMTGFAAWLSC
jgi:hypothetical protein